MARQCQRQFVSRHAKPIVGDTDQGLAAFGNTNVYTPRPGVQCVFNQFLDGGCRSFDHFARSNAINRCFVKLANYWTFIVYIGVGK